jgi:hypothetical protein
MRIWFTSQYRAVVVSLVGVLLTGLALWIVIGEQGLSERTMAASLLILCYGVFSVGGVLFTGRHFFKWPAAETSVFMRWERGFVIAGTLAVLLGLAMLEDMLHAAGNPFLARLGLVTYLFGAVLQVAAETTFLSSGEWNYPQIVLYVILAFLAQAAFGAALLQTGLVASWAGWATVIWNLGLLLMMLVVRPREFYLPVLHLIAPLIIGIALVAGGWA